MIESDNFTIEENTLCIQDRRAAYIILIRVWLIIRKSKRVQALPLIHRMFILQERRQPPPFSHFAGGYQPSGPPPGMDAMTHMHSQFHASPFQTTMPDQVLSSASVASHVDQIESMCIGESRRPLGHIREMIDSAKGSTQSRGLPGNRVELQTYRTDASMFSFESEFDAGSNTLQIKQSFRTISSRNRNGPYPNASDVYLGQLCKLQERKTGRDELPNRLPENIVRHRICNDQTKKSRLYSK